MISNEGPIDENHTVLKYNHIAVKSAGMPTLLHIELSIEDPLPYKTVHGTPCTAFQSYKCRSILFYNSTAATHVIIIIPNP